VEYVFTPDTSYYSATDLYAIAYGNGRYVAVGASGAVLVSLDATDWSGQAWSLSIVKSRISVHPTRARASVAQRSTFHNGPLGKAIPAGRALVSWISNSPLNGDVWGIAYGAGIFIAVGSNDAWSSVDGESWTQVASLAGYYETGVVTSIAFLNGGFVATWQQTGGDSSSILVSADGGSSWTETALPTGEFYSSVAYGSVAGVPTYVAVGWNGTIATSVNGVGTETSYTIPQQISLLSLTSVAYANGVFVAVGVGWNTYTRADNLLILVSTDGVNWSSQDLPDMSMPPGYVPQAANNYAIPWYCASVAATNGSFMIVADFQFPWGTTGSFWYPGSVVLTSTNGRSWRYDYWNTPLGGVTCGNGFYAIAQGNPLWAVDYGWESDGQSS
jgi:hypothetical protein